MTKKDSIKDAYFGELTISNIKDEQHFYLEKEISFGNFKNVTLSLKTTHLRASKKQFDLFKLIQANIENILQSTQAFYIIKYNSDLYRDFVVDSISLNDAENEFEWELWLTKKRGFEFCVIDMDKFQPKNISFQA